MKKILIDFETGFEGDTVVPITIGRIMLGNHVGRLYFHPDGKIKLYVDRSC